MVGLKWTESQIQCQKWTLIYLSNDTLLVDPCIPMPSNYGQKLIAYHYNNLN